MSAVVPRLLRSIRLCFLAIPALLTPLAAQSADSLDADSRRHVPILDPSDLALAAAFVSGLVLVEPAEALEEAITRASDSDGLGLDAALASVGDVAGRGSLDYGLAGATFIVGKAAKSPTVSRVGLHVVEALAIADMVAGLFKVGLGRARPSITAESDDFRFLEFESSLNSFPSGHTAHLFAIAGVISREFDEVRWVPYLMYPLAVFVGASRVIGRKHWVTDVISGAAVGAFAARVVDRINGGGQGLSSTSPILVPLGRDGIVLGLSIALP